MAGQQLSGGMQERVAISRHSSSSTTPSGALDAMTREEMNLELQRIWEAGRKTVLFITHSIAEAVFLADRVVVMMPRPGRVREVLPIDLPGPRFLHVPEDSRFVAYVRRIRDLIFEKG